MYPQFGSGEIVLVIVGVGVGLTCADAIPIDPKIAAAERTGIATSLLIFTFCTFLDLFTPL
jgi:hypothetical protein